MAPHPLDPLFHPRSVAVVGASSRPGAVSFVDHLIEQGCPNVYPVNPRGGVISGLPVYPTLDAIPGPVDHVISSIPANLVEPMVEQAGAKGVRSIHFFTAGFAETGDADRLALQERIVGRARALNIRIVGPNCLGLYVPASGLTFVGGSDDFRFRAFATATGEQLWERRLPSSVETTPITYLGADGRQFVTVVSTGGGLTGSEVTNDEIIAFALPQN